MEIMCNKDLKFGHNYVGEMCVECGRLQEQIKRTPYKEEKPKKELDNDQQLADEIYTWSGKQLKFPMLMGMIKKKGGIWIRQCWRECVADKPNDPLKAFMWKVGRAKMSYTLDAELSTE